MLGEVTVHGEPGAEVPVRGLPGLLLCLLALHRGQVRSSDRLISDLWAGALPQNPANALHRLVVRLRALLPDPLADRLVTRRPGYALRLQPEDLDLDQLASVVTTGTRLLDDGAATLARVRLDSGRHLIRGEPFGGRTDAALHSAAGQAHELILRHHELSVDVALALGDHHRALLELPGLVAAHPLRERLTEQLMLARYRAGQQSEALDAYRRTRSALVGELGVEPGPALTSLHTAVLRHDPSLRVRPTGSGPPAVAPGFPVTGSRAGVGPGHLPLLGAAALLQALQDARRLADAGRQVLVHLTGPAGSGRTRLIEDFASLCSPDDVALVTADATDRRVPAGVFDRVAPDGLHWPRIVLLDDATEADPTSLVRLARAHAEHGGLMVWAHRDIIGLPPQPLHRLVRAAASSGEVVGLQVPRLTSTEVQGLFVPGTDPELTRTLVRTSGGVARELARSIGGLLDRGLLVGQGVPYQLTGPATRSDLADVVAEEPDQGAPDLRLLDLVALAGRPVPVRVLAPTCRLTPDVLLQRLRSLLENGLLREGRRGLTVGGAIDPTRLVARLGEATTTTLLGQLADGWVAVGLDRADVGTVGAYYLDAGRPADALPLLAGAGLRAAERSAYSEALPLVEAALTAVDATDPQDPVRGRLLLARAQGRVFTGPLDAALEDATQAVGLLSGSERQRARVVTAEIAISLRQNHLAEEMVRAGQRESAGDDAGHLGVLLTLRAHTHSAQGRHGCADDDIATALHLVDSSEDPRVRADAYMNAGWIALERGEARTAVRRLGCAMDTGCLQDSDHEVNTRLFLARAHYLCGEIDEAHRHERRAERRVHTEGLTGMAALASGTRALGLLLMGRFAEALEAADEMLALTPHASLVHEIAARTRRAQALAGIGKVENADAEVRNALDLCPEGSAADRLRLSVSAVAARVASDSPSPWPLPDLIRLCADLDLAGRPLSMVEVLTCAASSHDTEASARQATRSALDLGATMHAARAAHAGGLWPTDLGDATSQAVRAMARHVPDPWRPAWLALPEVASAMTCPPASAPSMDPARPQPE